MILHGIEPADQPDQELAIGYVPRLPHALPTGRVELKSPGINPIRNHHDLPGLEAIRQHRPPAGFGIGDDDVGQARTERFQAIAERGQGIVASQIHVGCSHTPDQTHIPSEQLARGGNQVGDRQKRTDDVGFPVRQNAQRAAQDTGDVPAAALAQHLQPNAIFHKILDERSFVVEQRNGHIMAPLRKSDRKRNKLPLRAATAQGAFDK
jgi:hypothetical protein